MYTSMYGLQHRASTGASPTLSPSWEHLLRTSTLSPVKVFSKLNYFIVGYFDHVINFVIIKINIFRGDLSDISAKTASLTTCHNWQRARDANVDVDFMCRSIQNWCPETWVLMGRSHFWTCIFLQHYRIHMDVGNSTNYLGIESEWKSELYWLGFRQWTPVANLPFSVKRLNK